MLLSFNLRLGLLLLLGVFTVVWIGGWDMAEKRVRKCAGCKMPHDLHDFGAVSPYCLGRQEDQILPEGQEDESSAVQPGVQDGRKMLSHWKELTLLKTLSMIMILMTQRCWTCKEGLNN